MVEASQPKRNRMHDTSRISVNGGIDGGPSVSQKSASYLFDKRTGLPITQPVGKSR